MFERFVQTTSPHKHNFRGDAGMDMKEYQFGNAKVVIYSKLANLSPDEKEEWFEIEKAKRNPILQEISEAIHACYQD